MKEDLDKNSKVGLSRCPNFTCWCALLKEGDHNYMLQNFVYIEVHVEAILSQSYSYQVLCRHEQANHIRAVFM